MQIILSKKKLIKIVKKEKNLGFVPTMGAIHKGHLSLINKSNKICNKTIVSIFVNKPQFNNKTDYIKYPRNLKTDIKLLKKNRCDYLFLPTYKDIYFKGVRRDLNIHKFSRKLCGKNRPGHFMAVVDVIDRFIKIIKPNKIFLGEKDFQQFKIIENYMLKNNFKTKVILCRTIREKNGLALSSRNFLLNDIEKNIASNIYNLLKKNKSNILKNKHCLKVIKNKILSFGVSKLDYLKIININKLIYPYKRNIKYKIFIAYFLGKVRLIDNI